MKRFPFLFVHRTNPALRTSCVRCSKPLDTDTDMVYALVGGVPFQFWCADCVKSHMNEFYGTKCDTCGATHGTIDCPFRYPLDMLD